jgi:hypothetical protein
LGTSALNIGLVRRFSYFALTAASRAGLLLTAEDLKSPQINRGLCGWLRNIELLPLNAAKSDENVLCKGQSSTAASRLAHMTK